MSAGKEDTRAFLSASTCECLEGAKIQNRLCFLLFLYLFSAFFFLLFDNLSAEFGNLSFTRIEFQQNPRYIYEGQKIWSGSRGGNLNSPLFFPPHGKRKVPA